MWWKDGCKKAAEGKGGMTEVSRLKQPFARSKSSDPQHEGDRDRGLEWVKRRCDRQPEDERGDAERGRRSVTEWGDRATAVTGIHRRLGRSRNKLTTTYDKPA
jgi:hypothetical protein